MNYIFFSSDIENQKPASTKTATVLDDSFDRYP